jgi:hypothetical protein
MLVELVLTIFMPLNDYNKEQRQSLHKGMTECQIALKDKRDFHSIYRREIHICRKVKGITA